MSEKKYLIALVDDDAKIRELTAKYIKDQGLDVITADSGKELDRVVTANEVDLIILDLMMPEESGLTICQRYRVNKVDIQ